MLMVLLTGMQNVYAQGEQDQLMPEMAFIEFLGEGQDIDKEYLDPLRVNEYEDMLATMPQEGEQQND